jgi:hypothetical protein
MASSIGVDVMLRGGATGPAAPSRSICSATSAASTKSMICRVAAVLE